MTRFHCFAAVLCISLGLFVSGMAQTTGANFTDEDLEDFANATDLNMTGSDDGPSLCSELSCQGLCIEINETAYCTCEVGYLLQSDMTTCRPCPGGMYGVGCNNLCNCGLGGNTCDRVNGTCICNRCYTGTTCEMSTGSDCFVQFLANPVKDLGTLRDTYGTDGFPVVPGIYLRQLISSLGGVNDIDRGIITDVSIEPKNREEVNQGPLVQLKFTLDKNQGIPAVQSAISTLQNKVKVGEIAATLIVQDTVSSSTAEVTLNAGIKNTDS